MTVDFVPARLRIRSAPRKRLSLPGVLLVGVMVAVVACANSACSDRADDARAALTTSAARELAQTQPMPEPAFQAPSNSPDSAHSANGSDAITALAIRSPAHASASPGGASDADTAANNATRDAPLAPPEIHTAD